MAKSIFIQNIFSNRDSNIFSSKTISTAGDVETIINDIKSGQNTHIELDTFFDHFDIYRNRQVKKDSIRKKLATLPSHHPTTEELRQELQQIVEEERSLRIDILELALTLETSTPADESAKISAVKKAFREGALLEIDSILAEDQLLQQLLL